MALYLKYRPQSLDELVGQEIVKKILTAAFVANKLSHAYLFAGPRGTGKTSTARILAKMVNCQSKDAPCNKCDMCLSITDGSNLDLIEIDAASNRGIDDIRTLRENIKLSPTKANKKVYIIDEAHMLTTEAFNALLKTLEEPPAHALFILATTDASKLPQTILSRVQRLDFQLANQMQMLEALQKIIKSEKLDIDDSGLQVLAKKADGSFRDGVKLLDQISNLSGKITYKDITDNLEVADFNIILELLDNLASKKVGGAIILISNNLKNKDVKAWIFSMMDVLRDLMLIKNGLGSALVQGEYDSEKYQALINLAEKFKAEDLIKALNLLLKAVEQSKFSSIASLPLEIVVVEMCGEEKLDDRNLKMDKEVGSSKLEDQPSTLQHPTSSDDVVSPEVSMLQEKWNFVLETIKPYNFSLEALLRLVKILDCHDGMVVLEVPYSFHQRILEAPKSKDLLESVLSDILGKQARISCVLGNRPQSVEDIANIEVAADDEVIKAASEIFGSEVN